jgi:putative acetyltransferase
MEIRSVEPGERRIILVDVLRSAFDQDGHDVREELRIATGSWNSWAVPPGLELVAVSEGTLLGYVMASAALHVGESGEKSVVLGIAPLAVLPERQGAGVGTMLMDELLRRMRERTWPFVALLGDPGYYERFGFVSASQFGVHYGGVGRADPHFMVRLLVEGATIQSGDFTYCWELYPDGRTRYEEGQLPPYVSLPIRMACDWGAEVPLFPQQSFIESLVPDDLMARLKAWQADFEENFHWEKGWLSAELHMRWMETGGALLPEVRRAFSGIAEITCDMLE